MALWSICHCSYYVNVRCDDSEVEDYGSKWSMSALLRYLQDEGFNVAGNVFFYLSKIL